MTKQGEHGKGPGNRRHATNGRRPGGTGPSNRPDGDTTVIALAHRSALEHMTRFGTAAVPHKGGTRVRWNEATVAAATTLLHLYFFGTDGPSLDEVEIPAQETQMNERVVAEVRRRYTTACFLDRRVLETPGQAQVWFADVLAETEKFHADRRAARKAERESAGTGDGTQATAETEQVLVTA